MHSIIDTHSPHSPEVSLVKFTNDSHITKSIVIVFNPHFTYSLSRVWPNWLLPPETPFLLYFGSLCSAGVMVNFMCQFDWTTRSPDIWLNLILSVSVRVCLWLFLDRINIWLSRQSKADCPPNCRGGLIESIEDQKQKRTKPCCLIDLRWNVGLFLPLCF